MPKKLYSTPEVEVSWDPELCFHAAECVKGAPRVFNPRRRPWVELQHESTERILEVVARCPSGALSARRLAAGETGRNHEGDDPRVGGPLPILQQSVPSITASKNGPLLIQFACEIKDAEGNVIRTVEKASLCRCGQSQTKPFCDGSHRKVNFEG